MEKKHFWTLFTVTMAALLASSMIACSKDDDKEKEDPIDTEPIMLFVGEQKSIKGAKTISSANEFVAYERDLNVYGSHIGTTTVQVNGKASVRVDVLSKLSNLCQDPICNWGCDMSYVIGHQKEGSYMGQKDNSIVYKNAGCRTMLMYYFQNNKLSAVAALISTSYTSRFTDYLLERFVMAPYYEGKDVTFYGFDALTLDEAKTIVSLEVYSVEYLMVMYIQNSRQSRAIFNQQSLEEDIKEQIARILLD